MHSYGRGLEGVGWRECEGAPVLTVVVGSVGGPGEDVVPFENVGVTWVSDDEWRWVLGDVLIFACQTLAGGSAGHDGCLTFEFGLMLLLRLNVDNMGKASV